MSILLKKQPLIEVVCEFVFSDDNEWDWTIPGVIYEEVKGDFPVKSQEKGFSINFEDKDGEVLTHNVEGRIEKMVFLSKDHSALIQVGPNIFSINHLVPYPGWESFRDMIYKYAEIYFRVAKPKVLNKIGLRYINRFDNINNMNDISKFFNVEPQIPVMKPLKNFFLRNELSYEEIESTLICNMGLVQNEHHQEFVMLDFDFITSDSSYTGSWRYKEWIDKAHDYIEEAFNLCITDRNRDYLRGE